MSLRIPVRLLAEEGSVDWIDVEGDEVKDVGFVDRHDTEPAPPMPFAETEPPADWPEECASDRIAIAIEDTLRRVG